MRPYLAIVLDSFSEALASRVLWVLLVAISVVLLGMAPLGYREQRTTEFVRRDLLDARRLVQAFRDESARRKPTPAKRIWSLLDSETQAKLVKFQEDEQARGSAYYDGVEQLVAALNGLLTRPDLYDEASWEDVLLDSETRALLERDVAQLSASDLARVNRLLIEKACGECFRPLPPRQVVITYLGLNASPALQFSIKQVQSFIEKLVIPAIMSLLVGTIAVLAAVLVTAPIIPQMFDSGSLSLMLSKPVSRSLMFLAKFLGGCTFIVINVSYLVAGLWLIAGARFGIWNHRLLMCIPIFLFLFAIYYSVSALTGVVWRNAVVCVVMTVAFWLVCFVVGSTKAVFEQFTIEQRRLVGLISVNDALLAVDERAATYRWDAGGREWEPVFLDQPGSPHGRLMGPVYDAEHHMLLAARTWSRNFLRSSPALNFGKEEDGWRLAEGPALPEGTFALLPDPGGRLLAVTTTGVQRLIGDLEQTGKKVEFMWLQIPTTFGDVFRRIGPNPPLGLTPPAEAAVDHQTGTVVIYSQARLLRLDRTDGRYELGASLEIEAEKDQGGGVAVGGSTIVLALPDGRIQVYDAASLELRTSAVPEPRTQPRFVEVSPDGRWLAVVFQNGRLYLLDTNAGPQAAWRPAAVRGQQDVSAVAFPNAQQMFVVDRVTRVTEYEIESCRQTAQFAPTLSALEVAYYYVIMPIYRVFPKPGELDNTMLYLLQGQETSDMGLSMNARDLAMKRQALHPWAPVWSSLAFLIVMLGLACLYIERQDF